ncbi:hypothetical protein [Halorarius litoreus]|uniref:hypothetical protein n=1 Tax=Halorarius litoreus TaxID=2962676 RepID=UPI0020CF6F2C|nr:hypothetical protein [Halorarius litoreus]
MTDDSDGSDSDDDPFSELDDVDLETDPFAELEDADPETATEVDVDDLFTEVEVPDVDDEATWAALSEAESIETFSGGGERPDVETEPEEHIVPKRAYCEKCEHFSVPPETRCTNPGTEIRELVDMEHFQVANCPVVVQRRGITPDDD